MVEMPDRLAEDLVLLFARTTEPWHSGGGNASLRRCRRRRSRPSTGSQTRARATGILRGRLVIGAWAVSRVLAMVEIVTEDAAWNLSVPGHFPPDDANQARAALVIQRVRELAALSL